MLPLMNAEKAYNQALDYLYSFVDYSLKKSSELAKAEFNLERMRALMDSLGSPEKRYPIFHVAGTKGKGSTCAMIASALTSAGYKTGLYISPHLQDYTERIQVDGRSISHRQLAELVEEVKPHVAAIPQLTTFEITTALGFLFFAQRGVDAAVIEVGLGGRLDATNVVQPRVSVITSLSYDHMAVLGNTLTLIAGEKAGIIKEGIPVVSAPQKEEALVVIQRVAAERHSKLYLVGKDCTSERVSHSLDGQDFKITCSRMPGGNPEPIPLHIPLLGEHQVTNAATAYASLLASGLKFEQEAIRAGFAQTKWTCRFEIVQHNPVVILDSAHNPDSFARLDETLEENFPGKRVALIFGSSEDKDIPGMLSEMKRRLKLIIATRADHPRAMESGQIADIAGKLGIPVECVFPVEAALQRGITAAASDAVVVSAGSMFVTAEVKTAWQRLYGRRK